MKVGSVTGEQSVHQVQDVKKRRVFYIPGYDPMLPRRYRELYRSEGKDQAEISGYTLELKGKTGGSNYGWLVDTVIDSKDTHTEIEFLLWSDIVRVSMDRTIPGTFLLLARVVWIYVATGALFRLTRLRKGPVIAALYPVFMLAFQLFFAVLLGWAVGYGFAQIVPLWLGWSIGLVVAGWMMVWFRRIDNRLFAYYLLHDYAFSAQFYGANPPELADRMQSFVADIHAALHSGVDEVLLVGHSSGAHLGVSVLADLLRQHPPDGTSAKLGFLTLGQVVPMVSFLPKAGQLRADLQFLSHQDSVTWIDVTAPGDGCTFALCDPVSVSGADPDQTRKWPLVVSAAFTQSLSSGKHNRLKWRFFRLHFQYLCAFDRPGDYDYFQITAGPISLAQRYAGRVASPSRIIKSLSGFTSMDRG